MKLEMQNEKDKGMGSGKDVNSLLINSCAQNEKDREAGRRHDRLWELIPRRA